MIIIISYARLFNIKSILRNIKLKTNIETKLIKLKYNN